MSIKPPGWCSNAVPTLRGWEDPDTGELYVSTAITQEQINEFHGVGSPQVLTEAPANDKGLESMTKVELEELGRQHGIELDRRLKKDTLVEQLSDVIDD